MPLQLYYMRSRLSILCDKFIETGWIAAIILTPLFMNIYTHRMFEPDKASILRSIALLMLLAFIVKKLEGTIQLKEKVKEKTKGRNKPQDAAKPAGSPADRGKSDAPAPLPAITPAPVQDDWRLSFFFPAIVFVCSYVLSTITSETPFASIWGSYDRLQGLYTFSAYIIIFFLAATHIKRKEQVERIFTAVILTAIPITLYGLLQKCKLDPVPWQQMDPSARISSTMGNPIFFAAYIIMVVPLALSRLTRAIYQKQEFLIGGYAALIIGLIIAVFLALSRGPILALLSGIILFIFLLAWSERIKWLFRTVIITIAGGALFLILFNLPHFLWEDTLILKAKDKANIAVQIKGDLLKKEKGKLHFAPYDRKDPVLIYDEKEVEEVRITKGKVIWKKFFGELRQMPYISRLGFVGEYKKGTGRVRMILWKGVMQLVMESPFRFLVGHGPESLATVYYRYFTMELTKYEGLTVHADRSHNVILDSWVTQGVIGLIAFFFLISSIIYLGIRALRKNGASAGNHRDSNLLLIGLLSAIVAHIVETVFGIPIVCSLTHFWVYAAALFVLSRIKLQDTAPTAEPPANAVVDFDWTYYLFWTYIGFSILIQIILVRYYWPNENTDTNTFIIGTYVWLFAGLIIGALAIDSNEKTAGQLVRFGNSLLYLILFIVVFAVIISSNLNPIRADGYYKFCFSYDGGADQLVRNPPPNMTRDAANENAYGTRLASIPFYIDSLRFSPTEKNYLNGAGRNFLELTKLQQFLPPNSPYKTPRGKNRLTKVPTIQELLKRDANESASKSEEERRNVIKAKFARFTEHDFFLCSVACIEEAYRIEPENYERILSMVRIYRFWGQIEQDEKKLLQALDFCLEANRVAPLHDVPHREIKEIIYYLQNLRRP